jgi:hypothetical protein
MLNPIQHLECRREWLIECLSLSHNSEEVLSLSMKIENLDYEISRAYQGITA